MMLAVAIEPFKETLWVAAICGVLSLLALRLPYRYNPFRIGRLLEPILGEDASYKAPRWIGLMLGIGSIMLFAVVALMWSWYSYQDRQSRAEMMGLAATRARFESALIGLAQQAVTDSSQVDFYRLKQTGYGFELVVKNLDGPMLERLKQILNDGISNRGYAVQRNSMKEPNRSLYFNHDGRTLTRISFHAEDGNFQCLSPERPLLTGVLAPSVLEELNNWCATFELPKQDGGQEE